VPRRQVQSNSIQFNPIQSKTIQEKKMATASSKSVQPKPQRSITQKPILILRRMKKEENAVNVCRKKKLCGYIGGDLLFGGEIWRHDDFPLLLLVLSGFSVH